MAQSNQIVQQAFSDEGKRPITSFMIPWCPNGQMGALFHLLAPGHWVTLIVEPCVSNVGSLIAWNWPGHMSDLWPVTVLCCNIEKGREVLSVVGLNFPINPFRSSITHHRTALSKILQSNQDLTRRAHACRIDRRITNVIIRLSVSSSNLLEWCDNIVF